MVKTPRTRHSKSSKEPVTIDLEPDAVKRDKDAGDTAPGKQQAAETEAPERASDDGKSASENHVRDEPTTKAEPGKFGRGPAEKPQDTSSKETRAAGSAGGSGPTAPPRANAEPPSGGAGRALAAGVAGGVIALVLAAGLQWANVLPVPSPEDEAPDPATESLQQEVSALRADLEDLRAAPAQGAVDGSAVQEALAQPLQRIEQLASEVASLRETVSSGGAGENGGLQALQMRLEEMEEQVAALSTSAAQGSAGGEIAEQVAGLEQSVSQMRGMLEEIRQTADANNAAVETLGQRLESLSEQMAADDEGPRLALVVAASALRSAVERGEPYASELETYSALAPDASQLDPLRPYAQFGIPTRAELAAEAPEVASAIAAQGRGADPSAGLLDRLMASARSAIDVRPVGDVEGESAEAIAARMEAAVQAGNFEKALAEYETLPLEAKEAAAPFAEKLRARRAAEDILENALSSALKPA